MNEAWLKLVAKFDALVLRERRLVALALLGGIVFIGYSLFVDPALQRAKLAERNLATQSEQLKTLQTQVGILQSPEQDPEHQAQAELAALKKQLGALAARLKAMEGTLVPPRQMAEVLEEVVGQRSGLRLLSLKTLPAAPLLEKKSVTPESVATKAEAGQIENSAGLYKHGVEIRLEGSYQDLLAYLERLEKSKMKLLWSSVALSADKYPHLVLTLTVYTLSLDRTWLIV